MQTTATLRHLGIVGRMRTVLILAGLALVFAITPHPAGADQLPPATAGEGQAIACGLMGGHPTVDTSARTVGGLGWIMVSCGIKGLGGWWCVTTYASTTCGPLAMTSEPTPTRWLEALTGQVLPILETGSQAQIASAVTAFQADFGELTSARSTKATEHAADGQHGKDGTHHRHGHGKGRKG